MDSKLTISRVAAMLDTNVSTIRFYQRIGLAEKPPKNPAGYRYYSDQHVAQLSLILRAKSLGFTLEEARKLLHLGRDQCDGVQIVLKSKVEEVEAKISALEDIRCTLYEMIVSCSHNSESPTCPVIARLELV